MYIQYTIAVTQFSMITHISDADTEKNVVSQRS